MGDPEQDDQSNASTGSSAGTRATTDQETMIVHSSGDDSDFDVVSLFRKTSSAIMRELDRLEYPWMHDQDDLTHEEPDEEESGAAIMIGH